MKAILFYIGFTISVVNAILCASVENMSGALGWICSAIYAIGHALNESEKLENPPSGPTQKGQFNEKPAP